MIKLLPSILKTVVRISVVHAACFGVAFAQLEPPSNADTYDAAGNADTKGIWKAAVPSKPMLGEFNSLDPLGVAAGARIKADCSLNWVSPDDGKLYCFASGTSLVYFLDRPKTNIERANVGWRKLNDQAISAQ